MDVFLSKEKSVGKTRRYLKKEDRRTRWRVSDPAALPRLNLSAKVPRRCLRRLRRGLERSPRKFSSSSSRARVAVVAFFATTKTISSSRRVVRSETRRPSIQILSRRGRLEFSPESEKTSMTSSLDRTLSANPLDWRWRKGGVPIGNFKKRAVRWAVFVSSNFWSIDPFFWDLFLVHFFYIFTLYTCVPINA